MTNQATGKIKASRVNNLDAATYIGPPGQMWYDVNTGLLRLGDGVTAGGAVVGGGGNGTPGGPNASIQFNNSGVFGGTSNVTSDGANITATYFIGNGSQLTGITGSQVFITSNIANLQAGQPLNFAVDYSNITYPGGVFTLFQGNLPPTLTVTDSWSSSGTANKDQYLDFANGVVNSSNVSITLGLSSDTFNVQSSDYILIGSSNITGPSLTGLGISGSGGTYTIPASLVTASQTSASNPVSASLTTTSSGVVNASGTTLTTTAPVPFALTSITPSWTYPTIIGNVGNSQPINWTYAVTTGTPLSGNIIVTGNANITQASNTSTSGSTANVISTLGNFIVTASIQGNGTHGAGTSTSNVSATLAAATVSAATLTITDTWVSTGTTNKNQYTDFANGVVNSSNVSMSLTLSSGTFNVQSSDYILIGSSNITGANLTGLGITGSSSNITIPASLISTAQTTATSTVTANLTTSGGTVTGTGNTLTATAPVPFSLANVTANWTYPTIVGNVGNSQPINWNVAVTTGTVLSGNIIVTGNANITQAANTSTSGSTANVISTLGNFNIQASYQGNGTFGAGTSTSNVSVVLPAATVSAGNLVLYSQSTSNNAVPPLGGWVDASFGNTWQPCDPPGNILPGNTYGILTNQYNPTTEYYWLAIPDSLWWSYGNNNPDYPGAPPLYYNLQISLGTVNTFPDVAYGNGTADFGGSGGNITIGGVPYVALGFTGFANVLTPSTPPNVFIYVSTSSSI